MDPNQANPNKGSLKWKFVPVVQPAAPGGGGGGRSQASSVSTTTKNGSVRDVLASALKGAKEGITNVVQSMIKHPVQTVAGSQGVFALLATSSRPILRQVGKFGLKLIPTVAKGGAKVLTSVAGKLNTAISPWPKLTKALPTVALGLLATATTADVVNITIDQIKAIQGDRDAKSRLDQFVPGFMRGSESLGTAISEGRAGQELGNYIFRVVTGKYTRDKISSKIGG